MATFLVDVNLPYYFSLWHHSDFFIKRTLMMNGRTKKSGVMPKNNLTIITKDSHFSNRTC
ncbi:hypothetical protein BH24BAC1_BH24BAC1_23620 [soil metagenome]